MVVLVEMTVAMMMATVTTLQLHMWSRLLYCSYKYAYGYFNSYNYCPPRPLPRGAVVAGETHVPVPQVGRYVAVRVRVRVKVRVSDVAVRVRVRVRVWVRVRSSREKPTSQSHRLVVM